MSPRSAAPPLPASHSLCQRRQETKFALRERTDEEKPLGLPSGRVTICLY
jgi:hypothetical protein